MRTAIDMTDARYRKTKAVAALRGSSVKDLIACRPDYLSSRISFSLALEVASTLAMCASVDF